MRPIETYNNKNNIFYQRLCFGCSQKVFIGGIRQKIEIHLFWTTQKGFDLYQISESPWLQLKAVGKISLFFGTFFSRVQHSLQCLFLLSICDRLKRPEKVSVNTTTFADFFHIYEIEISHKWHQQQLFTPEFFKRKFMHIVLALIS